MTEFTNSARSWPYATVMLLLMHPDRVRNGELSEVNFQHKRLQDSVIVEIWTCTPRVFWGWRLFCRFPILLLGGIHRDRKWRCGHRQNLRSFRCDELLWSWSFDTKLLPTEDFSSMDCWNAVTWCTPSFVDNPFSKAGEPPSTNNEFPVGKSQKYHSFQFQLCWHKDLGPILETWFWLSKSESQHQQYP